MTTHAELRLVRILLAEDNPGDVRLLRETLKESRIRNHLDVVDNGVDVIRFLHRSDEFGGVALPDLILLDLNLPRKDGREVLAEIKSDPRLRRIPVVVLTSSKADEDIVRSYDLHANAYVTKPVGLDQFVDVVRQIEGFWFGIVRLPPDGDA